jgi:hypothetical protein
MSEWSLWIFVWTERLWDCQGIKLNNAVGRNEELEEEVVGFGQWLLPAVSVWITVLTGATTALSERNCRSFLIPCRQILEDLVRIKWRLLPPNNFSFRYKPVQDWLICVGHGYPTCGPPACIIRPIGAFVNCVYVIKISKKNLER